MPPGTRDTLITVATRLLDEGGTEAVTLREVGRLAGVSHNAPYKHFASKEALLAAVAARELTQRGLAMREMTGSSAAPLDVLRAALQHYVSSALTHPTRFKLIFGRWSTDSPELRDAAQDAHDTLIDVVVAAQAAGGLPAGDPVRLASLLRALVHGAADLASSGHLMSGGKGHAGPDDLVDDLVDHLRRAAEAGPPNTASPR